MKINEKVIVPKNTIPYNVWMLYYTTLTNPDNMYYMNVPPLDALVYKGDFTGLLISMEISSMWLIPLLIINDIKEPDMFSGVLRNGRLLFPKVSVIDKLLKEATIYVSKNET